MRKSIKRTEKDGNITRMLTIEPPVCTRILESDYKKGELRAEIKQVTHIEASVKKSISDEFQSNLFSEEDFGEDIQTKLDPRKSTKVAWIRVPAGTTVEKVNQMLEEKAPQACVYTITSLFPILTDNDINIINSSRSERGLTDYYMSQAKKYPEMSERAGEFILDSDTGMKLFTRSFFSTSPQKDISKVDIDKKRLPKWFTSAKENEPISMEFRDLFLGKDNDEDGGEEPQNSPTPTLGSSLEDLINNN